MKEFPPFRLDPVNQCLWRRTASADDERVLLTPTEFGVLDHLVAHAGKLVTHRDLLDAVWPRTAIEPQAVKSKIFHLRRALDDDPKQPRFIETVSRRGYRFVGKVEGGSAVGDTPSRLPAPTRRLVGRDNAIDDLWRSMRTASAGAPQVVFVTGEAGIGKTALVEEFQRQVASERTVRIARGQCVEGFGSKEPFYSVLDAVGELCRGPDVAATVDMLASHAPTWLAQFPALLTRHHHETLRQEILGATRERMLREICEALEAITRPAPLLLVLEDLHWADASTLDLISALARYRRPARLLLVVTYRPTEVAHSAQPLHSLKRDLVARHLCREIVLQPLSAAEIGHYLAQSVAKSAAGVPEELASLLHRHTEGNPLFMIAVLEHLVERGLVERDCDGWRLRRPAAEIGLEVPESLREMTGAQIDRLDELEQRVLEVAAIAGFSFAPAICAPSADMDASSFDECCDTLARRGHILRLADERQLPNGDLVQRYAFVHALYPRVLYERQAPARRATLHRRRAERLEQVFAATLDDIAPELAHHFEKGADWSRAVKYLRRAAAAASRRFSLDGARANLQHALALVDRLPPSEHVAAEVDLLYSLAGIYLATLDERVVDALTMLRAKAAEHGLLDVEVQALVDLAYPLAWSSSAKSMEVIDRALRLSDAQQDPVTRARTRARCMVRRLMARGWNANDADESRRALAEIRRLGTKEHVAWHLIDSGFMELAASHYRQVRRDADDSLAILREEHDDNIPLGYIAAHRLREYVVPWGLTFLGEWGTALREFDASIALADRNADPFGSGVLRLLRCCVQLFAMDFEGARTVCASFLAAPQQPGAMFGRHFCLTLSGAAESGLGNHEVALESLLPARDEMDRHMALLDWNTRFWQRWALTNVWLSTGDLTRARDEAELFVVHASATEERSWQAIAWETSARLALASGDPRGAEELIANALGAIDGFEAPVAAWQVHATAADVFEARGDAAAAAEHRTTSGELILRLASSLEGDEEELRRTFLTSPAVTRVLGERRVTI